MFREQLSNTAPVPSSNLKVLLDAEVILEVLLGDERADEDDRRRP
jgi:hypothetical protein